MTVKKLLESAKRLGIHVPPKTRKADIIKLLRVRPIGATTAATTSQTSQKRFAKRTKATVKAKLPPLPPHPEPPLPPPSVATKKKKGKRNLGLPDRPCPNIRNKANLEKMLNTPAPPIGKLGIFEGVRHCLYPHPAGSAADRKFLSRNTGLYRNKYYAALWWPDFIREVIKHEDVRNVCLLDSGNQPISVRVKINRRGTYLSSMVEEEFLRTAIDEMASSNRMSMAGLARIAIANSSTLPTLKPWWLAELSTKWDSTGRPAGGTRKGGCSPNKVWIPVPVSYTNGYGAGHRTFLLINRFTGAGYYFDSNGAQAAETRMLLVPAVRKFLVGAGIIKASEFVTVHFPSEQMGPQHTVEEQELLGHNAGNCVAWSQLFYHLFLINPHLSPDQVYDAMMKNEDVRPHLGVIISRYSMWLASWSKEALKKGQLRVH